MRISCLFLFLFCFSVFADQTVSFSYSLNQNPGNDSWVATSFTCPTNAISITNTSAQYAGHIGLVRLSDNQIIDVSSYLINPSEFAPTFFVRQTGYWETGVTISWTVNCNGSPQYPDDPDPDNPDPEDPDPDNPDPDPDNPDGNDQPWALESSLQTYMSNFRSFSQAFAEWASQLLYDVRAGNATLSVSKLLLESINQQQINDHDQRNSLHNDMKNFLGPLRDNVSGMKTGIDNMNIKSSQSLTAQNLGNSYLFSIDDYTGQIKDKTQSIDTKLSTANSNLSSIKNSLDPNGVSSPTASTPMSNLPSGSGFIQTVKSRLLPGYSFFTPSGDSWPSWTVTFPLSSFGMEDLTVVLGGSDWQTVAGGKIVWLASIIRTLSKFAFYLIFLNAVIRALRQW